MSNTLLQAITVLAVFASHTALGMDCFDSTSILPRELTSCPRPFKHESEIYCCRPSESDTSCCDLGDYVVNLKDLC